MTDADIQRLAAFADGDEGGNPAGVALGAEAFDPAWMQKKAAEIGYSETVFAWPLDDDMRRWRARYFAPEREAPFCGHATIALGAALGARLGAGRFDLEIEAGAITVEALEGGGARLSSPPTRSRPLSAAERADLLARFGLDEGDLDPRLEPSEVHGGATHAVLLLRERAALRAMRYDFDAMRARMIEKGWVTIALLWAERPDLLHARNAFAFGGVYEDPATGAAAAALGGLLRDVDWNGLGAGGAFTVVQGEDMGARSRLDVTLGAEKGGSVAVTGRARAL